MYVFTKMNNTSCTCSGLPKTQKFTGNLHYCTCIRFTYLVNSKDLKTKRVSQLSICVQKYWQCLLVLRSVEGEFIYRSYVNFGMIGSFSVKYSHPFSIHFHLQLNTIAELSMAYMGKSIMHRWLCSWQAIQTVYAIIYCLHYIHQYGVCHHLTTQQNPGPQLLPASYCIFKGSLSISPLHFAHAIEKSFLKLIRNSEHGFTQGKPCLTSLVTFYNETTPGWMRGEQ